MPHRRVPLGRASESVQPPSLPGGHQDDRGSRSLRASLSAADDLLTLSVARQGSVVVHRQALQKIAVLGTGGAQVEDGHGLSPGRSLISDDEQFGAAA